MVILYLFIIKTVLVRRKPLNLKTSSFKCQLRCNYTVLDCFSSQWRRSDANNDPITRYITAVCSQFTTNRIFQLAEHSTSSIISSQWCLPSQLLIYNALLRQLTIFHKVTELPHRFYIPSNRNTPMYVMQNSTMVTSSCMEVWLFVLTRAHVHETVQIPVLQPVLKSRFLTFWLWSVCFRREPSPIAKRTLAQWIEFKRQHLLYCYLHSGERLKNSLLFVKLLVLIFEP